MSSVNQTEWNLVSFEFEVGFRSYPDLNQSAPDVLNPKDQTRMGFRKSLSLDIGYKIREREPAPNGLFTRVNMSLQDILS